MSAESITSPGGYTSGDAVEQFEISDDRSFQEIQTMLIDNGFDPVVKDWDRSLHPELFS